MIQEFSRKIAPIYERRALVLDDNDGNRTLINFVMQLCNMDHMEAMTGREALALWQPGMCSFAFLDIELPDISGLEVARQIRAVDEGIAIIMCSTNDDPHTITAAIEAGCDIFLVKPFELDTLMNLVKVMNRPSLRAVPRVLIIDNMARHRWEARPAARPTHLSPN